jgi:cardiolipin synthase
MKAVEATLKLVEELPASLVESLIEQLRFDQVPRMPNPGYQSRVDDFLRVGAQHWPELASMVEVALAAKRSRQSVELVWTGPATPVVPVRRTEQVLLELIQEAQHKLTIMSFGIFQVSRLVQALEEALVRSVVLRIVLGDREAQSDWAIEQQRQQLGRVINARASLYWWPHERRLRDPVGCAGLMHAKAAVADSRTAFLTSANLTEAAFERNMELGVLIRGGGAPYSIERLVDALIESSELKLI